MRYSFFRIAISILLIAFFISCEKEKDTIVLKSDMQGISEEFVKLALFLGRHDPHYVDAYFGPTLFKTEIENDSLSLDQIIDRADSLLAELRKYDTTHFDYSRRLRYEFLNSQIRSLAGRAKLVSGADMDFDDESKILYGVEAMSMTEQYYKDIITELDSLIPGEGGIVERYNEYRQQFIIPSADVPKVIDTTLKYCKNLTLQHIEMPPGESFDVRYVSGEPWPAYNWFKGDAHSMIEINRDFDFYVDMALTIAAHEAYPGHHVYHSLTEKRLYRDSGWTEFSILPLFSPFALISEGSANYAVRLIFPMDKRIEFAQNVIFPIAGIDPELAPHYFKIQKIKDKLDYAGTDAARMYLDSVITREQAAVWLMRYQLRSRSRAEKYLDFIERYRSYVVNYVSGERLVDRYISRHGGDTSEVRKWELFEGILTRPLTPERLKNE
jgi:hypothetical protein